MKTLITIFVSAALVLALGACGYNVGNNGEHCNRSHICMPGLVCVDISFTSKEHYKCKTLSNACGEQTAGPVTSASTYYKANQEYWCENKNAQSVAASTWHDSDSGLTWQVSPSETTMEWQDAGDYCLGLNLAGYQDWRLPTISELRSLVRGCANTATDGICGVTDSCLYESCSSTCDSCDTVGGPDDGCYWPQELSGACSGCWSSSSVENSPNDAWVVSFYYGYVGSGDRSNNNYARCVRGGL